jgi:helicase
MPDAIDLVSGEWSATRRVRGLQGEYQPWSSLVPLAQFEMAHWESALDEGPELILRASATTRAISATRILDLASQTTDDLEPGNARDVAVLAALAYALHGNYAASGAVIERLKVRDQLDGFPAIYIAALGSASLRHTGELMRLRGPSKVVRGYLEVVALLGESRPPEPQHLREAVATLLPECTSAYEVSLVGLSDASLAGLRYLHLGESARHAKLDEQYIESLAKARVATLLPPQLRAIQGGLLRNDRDAVIALPTSTGKTLLGELCIAKSLGRSPGLAVYVTPYVALGSQVRDDLRRHLPSEVRVSGLFGGYQADAPLDPSEHREVVVATPERFDAMLRNQPELHTLLRCVVFDEAHHLGDTGRGLLAESLASRLKLVRNRSKRRGPRLVMMSAVVSNIGDIARWLDGADTYTDTWRPAAQRVGVWTQEGRLVWYPGRDAVTESTGTANEILGVQDLPWPRNGFRPTTNYGAQQRQRATMSANTAYLCRFLTQRYNESVLCVCATRATSRAIAAEAAELFEAIEPLPDDLLRATKLIDQRHRHLRPLGSYLRRGVAYHNASLPVAVRTAIESAARQGSLRLVAATTTLAEGVDLPFRYTVVADWLMWGDWGQEPMSPLLFSNIAGRSGRAGRHTEGGTVLVDNPVGDPVHVATRARGTALRRILGLEEEPRLTSSLADPRALRVPINQATLESQFLAAVPENPEDPQLEQTFVSAMLAADDSGASVSVHRFLQSARHDILSSNRVALATAASPLTLTEAGVAALHTGLSPRSFRDLLEYLQRTGGGDSGGAVASAADLLRATWQLPEQPNEELRKSLTPGKRSQIYVSDEDLERIVGEWLSGTDYLEMFTALPGVGRSQRKDRLGHWLEGQSPRSSWYDVFEKFASFMNEVFAGFLPWMSRAAGTIADEMDVQSDLNWSTLSMYLELGVDSTWAVDAMVRGAPASRWTVAEVGRRVAAKSKMITDPGFDEADLVGIDVIDVVGDLRAEASDAALLRELEDLERWLSS